MPQLDELAARAAAGDAVARGGLLAASMPMARHFARRLVDDAHAVDDVVQESLFEVYQSIAALRDPAAYRSWLALVVRKHADRYRRRLPPVVLLDLEIDPADPSADPAYATERGERISVVRRALWSAADSDRILLALRYYAELTDVELGRLLGISAGAARKRLHDARRRLRPLLTTSLTHPQETAMSLFGQLVDPITAPPLPAAPDLNPPIDHSAVLPTGIKVLDALAPWPLGGTVDLLGPVQTGHLVLLGEIAHNVPAAIVGVAAEPDDSLPPLSTLLNPELRLTTTTVVQASVEHAEAALEYGARCAISLAAEGSHVLLVVDRTVAGSLGPRLFSGRVGISATGGSVTGVRFAPHAHGSDPVRPWPSVGAVAMTSLEALAAGHLPAIDPLASNSSLLPYLSPAQRRLTSNSRKLLADAISVQAYWTQPFWIAEPFTGVPGEAFSRQQTLGGLAELVGSEESPNA